MAAVPSGRVDGRVDGSADGATVATVELAELSATPIGPVAVAVGPAGVLRVTFGRASRLRTELGRRGYQVGPDAGAAGAVLDQLADYLAGRRREFDCPVDFALTGGFHLACLRALRDTVPYGAVTTYGELAARAGAPGAARAVGAAMGANPVPLVVACHRVLGHDALGGFGGGRAVKEWLLALEGSATVPLF